MAQVEISQVNIKIGDKEISLTLAEARELLDLLGETFKHEEREPVERVIRERIVERYPTWPWRIWSGDSTITYQGMKWTATSGQLTDGSYSLTLATRS